MEYRTLGRTGIKVSAISLGTVSLGADYGLEVPGEFGVPPEAAAVALIKKAVVAGINLFDTAPAYGEGEKLLGRVVGSTPDCFVATKVSLPKDDDGRAAYGAEARRAVVESIETSLANLKRDTLDLVQIHNLTLETIERGDVIEALLAAKDEGRVRFLGASVYSETEALAAIDAGCFDTVQVAYSILDQRMAPKVFAAAKKENIGIISRSALLKGALTYKARWLPEELKPLRQAVERVREMSGVTWESLPTLALRFCLSAQDVSSVLVGARTSEELDQAVKSMNERLIEPELIDSLTAVAMTDDRMLNPTYWPVA